MTSSIRGVVFDLDDTLVFERDYVRSGFRHVANVCAADGAAPADEVFAQVWSDFAQGVRGHSFDRVRTRWSAVASRHSVDQLVEAYRTHAPSLVLAAEAVLVLETLKTRGTRLALISDGPLASQSAKVKALGLDAIFDPIVLTDAWGRAFWKPHVRAYEHIQAAWGLPHEQLVYVGDNPAKDFVAPNALGWTSVRYRVPAQLRHADEPASPAHAAGRTITDLRELLDA
jgi:putative hydrolase of the HAD superfamily